MKIIVKIFYTAIAIILLTSCSHNNHQLVSPDKTISVKLAHIAGSEIKYTIQKGGTIVIDTSAIGLNVNGEYLGKQTKELSLVQTSTTDISYPIKGVKSDATHQANIYEFKALEANGTEWYLDLTVSNEGAAFRYRVPGEGLRTVYGENTTFKLPAKTKVWYFERNNSWKLKSHAGEWLSADISQMPNVSKMGPVQGLSVTLELPNGSYALLAEAALYNYSGLRLKAIGNNTFAANFSEGEKGFRVDGEIVTPWRTVLLAKDLNALVNNTMISSLNPLPNNDLFNGQAWIKTGKSVWRWWSRGTGTYEEELQMIDDAATLGFEFSMVDANWEKWDDKWNKIKQLTAYAKNKGVGIFVWKHSNQLNFPENNYGTMAAFLDSVSAAGTVGIKVDFMNGHDKSIIDFDEKLLIQAAQRKLMVNFHGCQQSSGESRTYPNEVTREGIRGGELNIMKVGPIPAFHNAALPFTRFVTGHADYTPLCLTRPGKTTWAHQLATLVCFYSPFQCIAENTNYLLNNKAVQPLLDLIKKMPPIWDETIVLEGSKIGELAVMARRKGNDWYIGVINGGNERNVNIDFSFTDLTGYKATLFSDDLQSPKINLQLTDKDKKEGHANPYGVKKEALNIQKEINVKLAEAGGCVIHLVKQQKVTNM